MEPGINKLFRAELLRGLSFCLEKPIESNLQVYNTLECAARNYRDYDEYNWQYLASIAMNKIYLPDANNIVINMISDIKVKLKTEEGKKKKFNLQSKLKYLRQQIEKYNKRIKAEGFKKWVIPTLPPQLRKPEKTGTD